MEAAKQILANTPWWVYVLFLYLIYVGIKASKPGTVSIHKLYIIPIIFTYLSIDTLITAVKINLFSVGTWLIAIIIGVGLGWLQVFRSVIQVDRPNKLVKLPGTWTTLVIIIIIFACKYYFGYELGVDPLKAEQTGFEFSMLAISGLCTGLFIGRLICYLYRLKNDSSVDLKKNT